MKTNPETPACKPSWLSLGAVFAAIGASICCVSPFLFLSLGIGVAWISTLMAMEPIRPFFIILALVFIILGYRKLYWTPFRFGCEKSANCAISNAQRTQHLVFWLGSSLILMLLAFPWLAPFFVP